MEQSYIFLKPDAQVIHHSNDLLQIVFPNYTVTFNTAEVVTVMSVVLNAIKTNKEIKHIISTTSSACLVDEEFVMFLLGQLISNNCAYYAENNTEIENPLTRFYAYVNGNLNIIEKLASYKFILLTSAEKVENCKKIFNANGLFPKIISAVDGKSYSKYLDEIRLNVQKDIDLIAIWGFPYRIPITEHLNRFCISMKIPVLFGATEGAMGRMGPFILPGHTACLNCLNLRLQGNFDENELIAFNSLKENTIQKPWTIHPGFEQLFLNLFSIEISNIALGTNIKTLGRLYENNFGNLSGTFHKIIRVSNCNVCSSSAPKRFSWDIRHSAPNVKNQFVLNE